MLWEVYLRLEDIDFWKVLIVFEEILFVFKGMGWGESIFM